MTPSQSDALKTWASSHVDAVRFDVCITGRRIESATSGDGMVAAIERHSSLSATTRTFQIIAFDVQGEELARTEVKVDPRAGELAKSNDRELATREAAATAQVIAASDHRVVAATIKTLGEQVGESHSALLGMVAAFGKAGGELVSAHALAVKAIDERASRAESRITRLEDENDKLREENKDLFSMLKNAVDDAERFKREKDDLLTMVRGAFGPKVDALIAGFAAKAQTELTPEASPPAEVKPS